jgi:hypothetical protein
MPGAPSPGGTLRRRDLALGEFGRDFVAQAAASLHPLIAAMSNRCAPIPRRGSADRGVGLLVLARDLDF